MPSNTILNEIQTVNGTKLGKLSEYPYSLSSAINFSIFQHVTLILIGSKKHE